MNKYDVAAWQVIAAKESKRSRTFRELAMQGGPRARTYLKIAAEAQRFASAAYIKCIEWRLAR